MEPKTRYAKSGDVHIAYQMLGNGDRDLLLVPGFISHVEHFWEDPGVARFLRRMASFSPRHGRSIYTPSAASNCRFCS